MTDRELLELAAKAAQIELSPYQCKEANSLYLPDSTFWNPLTDDGDALRLAVKLDFIDERKWKAPVTKAIFDQCNGDWCVATRRAIVHAAALIGKEST